MINSKGRRFSLCEVGWGSHQVERSSEFGRVRTRCPAGSPSRLKPLAKPATPSRPFGNDPARKAVMVCLQAMVPRLIRPIDQAPKGAPSSRGYVAVDRNGVEPRMLSRRYTNAACGRTSWGLFSRPRRSSQVRIFPERWETAFSRFVQIRSPVLMISYTFSIFLRLQPIEKTKKPSHGFVQRDSRRHVRRGNRSWSGP